MTDTWFPGQAVGRLEEATLTALRLICAASGLQGARREDTTASTPEGWPLVLSVRIPELRAAPGDPHLQVGVVFSDDGVDVLGGWETFEWVLDSGVDLLDLAPEPQPGPVASAVHAWIKGQLAPPVLQDEWTTFTGRIRRSWHFGDTGSDITGDLGTRWLAARRKPDRVLQLR